MPPSAARSAQNGHAPQQNGHANADDGPRMPPLRRSESSASDSSLPDLASASSSESESDHEGADPRPPRRAPPSIPNGAAPATWPSPRSARAGARARARSSTRNEARLPPRLHETRGLRDLPGHPAVGGVSPRIERKNARTRSTGTSGAGRESSSPSEHWLRETNPGQVDELPSRGRRK